MLEAFLLGFAVYVVGGAICMAFLYPAIEALIQLSEEWERAGRQCATCGRVGVSDTSVTECATCEAEGWARWQAETSRWRP